MNVFGEAHTCDKCKGKIVCLAKDAFGNLFCAYCGKPIDKEKYSSIIHKELLKSNVDINKGVQK